MAYVIYRWDLKGTRPKPDLNTMNNLAGGIRMSLNEIDILIAASNQSRNRLVEIYNSICSGNRIFDAEAQNECNTMANELNIMVARMREVGIAVPEDIDM